MGEVSIWKEGGGWEGKASSHEYGGDPLLRRDHPMRHAGYGGTRKGRLNTMPPAQFVIKTLLLIMLRWGT